MNTESLWKIYCVDCTQECSTNDFIIKTSSLAAPHDSLLTMIKQFVEFSSIPLPVNWSNRWKSEISQSYLSLEIAYESTRTEIYTQQASISPGDVISNVGGQTGLWIGISFLSLMEIAEMIYRLIRNQYHTFRHDRKEEQNRPTKKEED